MRNLTPYIVAPILKATGFRFSKAYRHGTTAWNRLVYAVIDTTGSNIRADQ